MQHPPRNSPRIFTVLFYFFLKEREDENIQKRDWPFLTPSLRNSCPRPLPHFPQETLSAPGESIRLETLSDLIVEVNAGQGEECLYLTALWKSSLSHFEQT